VGSLKKVNMDVEGDYEKKWEERMKEMGGAYERNGRSI